MASSPSTETPMEAKASLDASNHHSHHHHHHPPHPPHNYRFDLKIVRDAFVNCIQSDNTLLLREYIRAYEELCV